MDPDGREQNFVQKKVTDFLSNQSEKNEKVNSFVKEHTKLDVKRGKEEKVDDNDVTRIKFLGVSLAKFTTQSEKNYRTQIQTQSQRFDDDAAADAITLPKDKNYKATLIAESGSYNRPLSITNSKEINGSELTADRWFLFHSYSKKNATYTYSMSHGCQIMSDSDFSDFRGNLESLGFNNGDSIKLRIR